MKVFTLSIVHEDGDGYTHLALLSLHQTRASAEAAAVASWRLTPLRDVVEKCSNNPETQQAIVQERKAYNDRVLTGLPRINYDADHDHEYDNHDERSEYEILEVEVQP